MTDFMRIYLIAVLVICLAGQSRLAEAQAERTSTPIVARLVTPTPVGIPQVAPTVTATSTATPQGPASLQARESAGRVNVRLEPDTNSDLLGTISYGTLYPLLRRYYLWFELSYDLAPNGRAWVFGELVDVDGDLDAVPVISDFAELAIATGSSVGEASGARLGDSTSAEVSTVVSRNLVISSGAENNQRGETEYIATPLPTFTYPPDVPTFSAAVREMPEMEESQDLVSGALSDLPPLFPIVMLAGFGIVGMLISMIRR